MCLYTETVHILVSQSYSLNMPQVTKLTSSLRLGGVSNINAALLSVFLQSFKTAAWLCMHQMILCCSTSPLLLADIFRANVMHF